MDELGEDGKFSYQNKELGFKVKFPESFLYYQVQRKDTEEYKQIEFYEKIESKINEYFQSRKEI